MIKEPLKFIPILKEKIWGGEKLNKLLKKKSDKKNIGESWEISDVENEMSIVANGKLKGQSIQDVIEQYKGELVGEKVYQHFGNKFPLLIKFIDAKEALSIQLHPNDKLAKKRHNSFGKTEMWYVMQADKNA
ncbi:MAG TPA: mannose-6-phosphate isomerase, partial [Flavobacteriaceae bacterium]|nr:mannose-6-phosphate isomerase [Flavobacteriaceae bacterium]